MLSLPRPILENLHGLNLENLCAKKAVAEEDLGRALKAELQGKRGRTSRGENDCICDADARQ